MLSGQAAPVDIEEFFRLHTAAYGQDYSTVPAPAFRGSLFESYDLRTETRDFDAGRQQFMVRFNFGSPGLMRARRALYAHVVDGPPAAPTGEQCARVETLYEDWVELYALGQQQRLYDSLLLIEADRQRLSDYATGALLSEPEDRYRLRTDRTNLAIDTLQLHRREQSLRRYYALTEVPLRFALPTVDDIRQRLARSQQAQAAALAAEQAYRLAALDREEALELAEGRQLLDFLQFQYNSNNREELREKFSVGIAFRIQDSGDRRLKLQELRLEREELARDYRLSTQVFLAKEGAEREQLAMALDYYTDLLSLIEGEGRDLQELAQLAGRDRRRSPDLLLRIAERNIRQKLRVLRAYMDVIDHYLQWREARDELCGGADGQWLSGPALRQ